MVNDILNTNIFDEDFFILKTEIPYDQFPSEEYCCYACGMEHWGGYRQGNKFCDNCDRIKTSKKAALRHYIIGDATPNEIKIVNKYYYVFPRYKSIELKSDEEKLNNFEFVNKHKLY